MKKLCIRLVCALSLVSVSGCAGTFIYEPPEDQVVVVVGPRVYKYRTSNNVYVYYMYENEKWYYRERPNNKWKKCKHNNVPPGIRKRHKK